ncbi:MAG: prepilin-type N-terminal cleavage/methylation domain-containing protein [Candidatus Omnitrophota bacterium]|nr:prepilin-type N-terminal cleavage/methylation domain-containing protein [Candidatus Omnitrophota bacterium]
MKWRSKKGFTLIELMVAVAILLVSSLALLSGFLGSMFLNDSSNHLTTAVNYAQYVLEQVRELDYNTDIYGANFSYTPPSITNSYETVVFTPAIEKTDMGGYSKVTINITWQEKQQEGSYSLATYFSG